ncbi:hypothetical protein HRbin12_01699 [bacterium HR12]|nr:hypothetical protein HRbin12_01699 [bacterium HR12]GIU99905.1 MAG: hypothetical protein KatS3mg014_1521 [Actinomycetota bacterium]
MARDVEWAVFEKAVEITASAVRGTLGGQGSQPPSFAAEVFKEVYTVLRETAAQMPEPPKPGF